MSQYQTLLIANAMDYWGQGNGVPLNLFAEMLAEGIDVTSLEAIHRA